MKELKQLLRMKVMYPVKSQSLTHAEKIASLWYLMFLKEKRSRDIKG